MTAPTPDRTPTGDLRERLAEALYRRLREQVGSDAGAQIRAEAKADDLVDAVLPVVEAETAALRERVETAERDVKREKAAHRMATQHAANADAREAEAEAEAARTQARYATERAARLREQAERLETERQRDEYRERFTNQMTAATELTDTLREAERQRDDALRELATAHEAWTAVKEESADLIAEYSEPAPERVNRCGSCRQHETVDSKDAAARAMAKTARRYQRERDEACAALREFVDDRPCTPHPGTGYCQTHGQRPPCPHAAAQRLLAALDGTEAGPPGQERAVPVDWEGIVRQRERELKREGEARHQAETAVRRSREALAAFDGRGVSTPERTDWNIPTAGEVLEAWRASLDAEQPRETL